MTHRKIVNWRMWLRFPDDSKLSPESKDLVQRLLCDVGERLGTHGGAAEIKAHPFFKSIDWSRLRSQQAPCVPSVEHELDTQNFDKYEEDANAPRGQGRKGRTTPDSHFIGYTYKNYEAVQRDEQSGRVLLKKKSAGRPTLDALVGNMSLER